MTVMPGAEYYRAFNEARAARAVAEGKVCPHKRCDSCGLCSAYLAECPMRASDDKGRVSGPDKHGSTLHAECRRQIRLYGDVY